MPARSRRVRFETEYNSSFKAFDENVYKSPLVEALVDKSADNRTLKSCSGIEELSKERSTKPPLHPKDEILNSRKKNRALALKAGLRPESSLGENKHPVSEYERQYHWKNSALEDSPLVNAEKVVFDSHTNIPRFVRDKIPRKTEYQSKFGAKKLQKALKWRKERGEEKNKQEGVPTSAAVRRVSQICQNPDVPFFPHGPSRVFHTEYQANYGSPKKYQYQEGIWLGAKPPHFLPDDESTQASNEEVTNWFEEVLELREKAKQYKIRALQGNYFSREFMAELDAELEKVYQNSDDSSEAKNDKNTRGSLQPHAARKASGVLPRTVKHAWESNSSSDGDAGRIYKDLEEQFKNKSNDGDSKKLSGCSENKSVERALKMQDENEKRYFGKTFSKTPDLPNPSQPASCREALKRTALIESSSGSDASSERSSIQSEVTSGDNCSNVTTSSKNKHLKFVKNDGKYDPDKFNIETVRRIRSNDVEADSSPARYSDEVSEKSMNSGYDRESDYMSESSFASRESLARRTLSRAKQRNDAFWKK